MAISRSDLVSALAEKADTTKSTADDVLSALADVLIDARFTREDPVDEHGSFTMRGGIVDVFPAGDAEPVRIEFVGDMVETLRRFDPATQRSSAAADQVLIVPVRERFDLEEREDQRAGDEDESASRPVTTPSRGKARPHSQRPGSRLPRSPVR